MMPTFTDYAYYTAHGGKLPEADYNASVHDAYAEILSQTNGAALTAPEEIDSRLMAWLRESYEFSLAKR